MVCYQNLLGIFLNFFSLMNLTVSDELMICMRLSCVSTRSSEILREQHVDVDHGKQFCQHRRPIHAMHLCLLLSDRPLVCIYKHDLLNLIFLIALPRRRSLALPLTPPPPPFLSSLRSYFLTRPVRPSLLVPSPLISCLCTHPRPRSLAALL